jgi:hypothetical protein
MLTIADVESELSYAYLHAVASYAGFSCCVTNRHLDNQGVDARIDLDGRRLADDSRYTSMTLDVQLKATIRELPTESGRFSFSLPIHQYEKLRSPNTANPKLLVVLRLPKDKNEWLTVTTHSLIARRCAYWCSLLGAAQSMNTSEQTVHIPESQALTKKALVEIMTQCSRGERPRYVS